LPILIAVLDANVLYPAPMRDFLLQLAFDDFFEPKWSDEIQDEWARNVLADRSDLTAANVAYTQGRMKVAFPSASVTGYEHLIPQLTNDIKDRHVLAAAIQARATCIVTCNLKDFKPADLAPHGIQAIHPDDFLLKLYQDAAADMIETIRRHRARLTQPPKTAQQYLDTLQKASFVQTAAALQKHLDEI
jgi:predicted nucleic acid-binding protein